jgi:hypothetical protein
MGLRIFRRPSSSMQLQESLNPLRRAKAKAAALDATPLKRRRQ